MRLSNTIGIGSIVEVNRLMKQNFAEVWQYFGNNICNILSAIWQ